MKCAPWVSARRSFPPIEVRLLTVGVSSDSWRVQELHPRVGVDAPALPPLAIGGHVTLGGGEKKHTNADTLENSGGEEGGAVHAQWEAWGCANETWRTRCVCVCMRACLFCVCMCTCVFCSQAGGYWTGARALVWVGRGSPNGSPCSGHAPRSQSSHNNTRTVGHARRPATPPPHPHPSIPPTPPGTPLLRNEVIIEVDTVYAVRGGDAAEGTAGGTKEPGAEGGAGGTEKRLSIFLLR